MIPTPCSTSQLWTAEAQPNRSARSRVGSRESATETNSFSHCGSTAIGAPIVARASRSSRQRAGRRSGSCRRIRSLPGGAALPALTARGIAAALLPARRQERRRTRRAILVVARVRVVDEAEALLALTVSRVLLVDLL